ncbi:PREDICTED: surfeit locus protein 1-like [Priapulus caudatus]|uniref:SURF1-like protein n=1 Tax=Priapulus caudatus TaxID=37621 RepID=A0ABM1E5T1_PRICU|nr:PREDICTED: surfeit locus protein 1-like [Priapulus caudatus]
MMMRFGRSVARLLAPSRTGGGARHVSIRRGRSDGGIGAGGYALLVVPATAFALGAWQVRRRRWKLNLIDMLDTRLTAPPVPLPDDVSAIADMEYRRVHVQGSFDHAREMYVTPRSLVTPGDRGGGGGMASDPSRVGTNVVTPFRLASPLEGTTILVNRGWVPRARLRPETRADGQIAGEIQFVGVLRLSDARQPFMPRNDPASETFSYRDVEEMARRSGAAAVFVDADADSTVPGGPVGGQTRVRLRNEHLSYIATWWSLSAATSYMWYRKVVRRIPLM